MNLSSYSENQQQVINQIIKDDAGFHSRGFIADYPFSGMSVISDDGTESISKFCNVDVNTESSNYNFELSFSKEQNCWFIKLSVAGSDVSYLGSVHFNVIENARADVAFVILNDNACKTVEDITYNLQYSNILILEM